jgi:hypothetical protein
MPIVRRPKKSSRGKVFNSFMLLPPLPTGRELCDAVKKYKKSLTKDYEFGKKI